MGSNGLTSARHDVFGSYLAAKYPRALIHHFPMIWFIRETESLLILVAGTGMNAGKLVLSPTRTYAPVIKKILESMR